MPREIGKSEPAGREAPAAKWLELPCQFERQLSLTTKLGYNFCNFNPDLLDPPILTLFSLTGAHARAESAPCDVEVCGSQLQQPRIKTGGGPCEARKNQPTSLAFKSVKITIIKSVDFLW